MLYQEREERGLQKDIAISRVEQVFPFPYDMLSEDLARHPNAEVCVVFGSLWKSCLSFLSHLENIQSNAVLKAPVTAVVHSRINRLPK